MKKLKFAFVLPTLQVFITAILTWWANRVSWILLANTSRAPGRLVYLDLFVIQARVIWRGVNAPASPLVYIAEFLPSRKLLSFGVGDVSYLAGVAILWYSVGKALDHRIPSTLRDPKIPRMQVVTNCLLVVWAVLLLAISLKDFGDEIAFARDYFVRIDAFMVLTLFLSWSLVLLVFPGARLARLATRKRS
jgi:hypothetical protein